MASLALVSNVQRVVYFFYIIFRKSTVFVDAHPPHAFVEPSPDDPTSGQIRRWSFEDRASFSDLLLYVVRSSKLLRLGLVNR